MTQAPDLLAKVPWPELGAAGAAIIIGLMTALSGWLKAGKAAAPAKPDTHLLSSDIRVLHDDLIGLTAHVERIADAADEIAQLSDKQMLIALARNVRDEG